MYVSAVVCQKWQSHCRLHEQCTTTYCGWLNTFSAGNWAECPVSFRWCNNASRQSNDSKQIVHAFKWICHTNANY